MNTALGQELRKNTLFLGWFFLFLLLGAILLSSVSKGDLVLFFSERRSPFWDAFFKYGTSLGEFFGYILVFLLLLFFYRIRYALGTMFLGVASMLIARVLKLSFSAPRPLAYFKALDREGELTFVEGVRVHEWLSFPSGHTLGAFALFTYLAFLLPQKTWAANLLFLLALMVGLSRIYLVQHFVEDVYAGAIVGVLLGMGMFFLVRPAKKIRWAWLDKSLTALWRKQEKEIA